MGWIGRLAGNLWYRCRFGVQLGASMENACARLGRLACFAISRAPHVGEFAIFRLVPLKIVV